MAVTFGRNVVVVSFSVSTLVNGSILSFIAGRSVMSAMVQSPYLSSPPLVLLPQQQVKLPQPPNQKMARKALVLPIVVESGGKHLPSHNHGIPNIMTLMGSIVMICQLQTLPKGTHLEVKRVLVVALVLEMVAAGAPLAANFRTITHREVALAVLVVMAKC